MGFLVFVFFPWYIFEIFLNSEVIFFDSLKNVWGGAVGGVTDETRWPSVGNCWSWMMDSHPLVLLFFYNFFISHYP